MTSIVTRRRRSAEEGRHTRVGCYIEAVTMDPHLSGRKVDRQVYHNIYEPLLALDTKLKSVGDIQAPSRRFPLPVTGVPARTSPALLPQVQSCPPGDRAGPGAAARPPRALTKPGGPLVRSRARVATAARRRRQRRHTGNRAPSKPSRKTSPIS